MCYTGGSGLISIENIADIQSIFVQNGWTFITAICTALFFVNHFPCATTLWTIKKENRKYKMDYFFSSTAYSCWCCTVYCSKFCFKNNMWNNIEN